MKKSLIITIAAALLIAAVLCTAGCVDTKTADPVVGDWFADDNESLTVLSVYGDGTGAYITAKANVSASGETEYVKDKESAFVWAKNADGTYLISFADGNKSTAEVNTQRGILTLDDGSRFEKQTSELSGASGMPSRERAMNDNDIMVEIKKLEGEIKKLEDERQNLEEEIKKLEGEIEKLEGERKKPAEEQME